MEPEAIDLGLFALGLETKREGGGIKDLKVAISIFLSVEGGPRGGGILEVLEDESTSSSDREVDRRRGVLEDGKAISALSDGILSYGVVPDRIRPLVLVHVPPNFWCEVKIRQMRKDDQKKQKKTNEQCRLGTGRGGARGTAGEVHCRWKDHSSTWDGARRR